MKRPRGVIFDFGSTVLCEESFDVLSGNARLLEFTTNPHNLTPAEVQAFADEINREIQKVREEQMIEFSIRTFNRLLYETLGIKLNISDSEAERYFWQASTSFAPAEGIVEVLDFLQTNEIKIGILSNVSFSGYILEEELARHNLTHYFSFVIASSDYGFRKPNPRIFNVAIRKMNLDPSDIWFVGDKLENDVKGAIQSNLYPVWYNPEGKLNPEKYNCLEVRSWHEFIEKLQLLV